MKILRIITRLNIGGPALQAISLTENLENSLLVIGTTLIGEQIIDVSLLEKINKNIILVGSLKREIGKHDYYAFKNIRAIIKKSKPDILHTHMSKAGFLGRLAVLSIRKKNRPKIVHTFHGHTFHSYFGWFKSFIFRRIEIFLAKRGDAIIAISKGQAEELIDYGLPANKIRTILLGFDLEPFLKLKEFRYDSKRALRVGFVGRLAPIKNIALFVEVVEELKKHFKVELYIAGDGPEKEKLKPIEHEIIVQQFFDRKNMVNFYDLVDIVICTSKNEGTPVGLIEAMASGKLIFSTMVGGVKDLIGKGIRGRYIYPEMLNFSVQKLKEVLNDGSYKDLIYDARKYVERLYQIDKLVANINDLYRNLLNEK